MNKEELEHKLDQARIDRTAITIHIDELEKQLAEAEKPKLRHGDFGYSDESCFPRIVLADNQLASAIHVFEDNKNDRPTVIFGNIFDLLAEWSEDLEEFEVKGARYAKFKVRIACDKDSIISTIFDGIKSSPIITSIPDAEKIWRKLGRVIATLKKRKNSPQE